MTLQYTVARESEQTSTSGNACRVAVVSLQEDEEAGVAVSRVHPRQVVIAAIRSRLADYIFAGILFAIAAPVGKYVRPYCRPFEWTDPAISYSYTPNTFPMWSVILCMILVCIVYIAGEYITYRRHCTTIHSFIAHVNGWIVTHLYSVTIAFVIVNLSKLYAGRLRPDFIDRLRLENITIKNSSSLTPEQLCAAAREGRLSFPSGHSSSIFSGIMPVCLYLLGLFRVLHGGSLALVTIALSPLILPIAVAISRTRDHRHNFDDILAGSLIGILAALLCVGIMFKASSHGEWALRSHSVDS